MATSTQVSLISSPPAEPADAANWPALLQAIDEIRAQTVWVTHGEVVREHDTAVEGVNIHV